MKELHFKRINNFKRQIIQKEKEFQKKKNQMVFSEIILQNLYYQTFSFINIFEQKDKFRNIDFSNHIKMLRYSSLCQKLKISVLPIKKNIFLSISCSAFSQALQHQFHENRLIRQQSKQKLMFRSSQNKLIKSPIQLKYLVPTNIFQQQVIIEEYEKILVQNTKYNHFQNSYSSINLNIAENKQLKQTLMRYNQKGIRIGRLMEIMDMIAGLVSYRHCFGSFRKNNPFTLVTGSVQSFQLFEPINCEDNLQIQGFLNFTGKTSMQIEVSINQSKRLKANSFFTMVCRNSLDLTKGYEIPQLNISLLSKQELCKAQRRKNIALQHIQRRKQQIAQSFDRRPPMPDQIKQIHELFLKQKKSLQSQTLSDEKKYKISQTYVQTNQVMHIQDRNVHGKIFGGFLMRQMLEIGYFAGKKFLNGNYFEIEGLTDIYFVSAVEIGDGLTISASITYSQGNIVIATVEAHTINFKSGQKKLCCSSQLILLTNIEKFKLVYPDSYAEALKYLNSRRTISKMFGVASYNL